MSTQKAAAERSKASGKTAQQAFNENKPKSRSVRRSIDDIVRRAVDEVLFGEEEIYARDAELDIDDLYY